MSDWAPRSALCFGLVYVLVNVGELPSTAILSTRVLGVATFAGLLVMLVARREERAAGSDGPGVQQSGFGRGYWTVVIIEVIALFGGLRVINGPMDIPEASVGWVSLVVGLHFVALAAVWRNPLVRWLGAVIAVCGAIGVILVIAGAPEAAITVVAGVVPAFILLGTGWWFVLGRGTRHSDQAATP